MSERRVVFVTGSTDGIGYQVVRALAARDLKVLVHGRSKTKVDAAIAKLMAELGARASARSRARPPRPARAR
jgi:NAD(P)-dependent dehydrogenase (short-subunit alcohol dehydrogenase family)